MRLHLIRHGETDYNRHRLIQGHTEQPLNDLGIAQAARLARRFETIPLTRIYSSDVRRAAMTACILSARTSVPVVYESLWRERDPGELVDRSYTEAIRFFTDPDYAPLQGESRSTFDARVQEAVEKLLRLEANGDQRQIAVVTHGMVCASFLRCQIGLNDADLGAIRHPNTSVTVADYEGGWNLIAAADASHLGDLDPRQSVKPVSGF